MYNFQTDYSVDKCKILISRIIDDDNYIKNGYSGKINSAYNQFILRRSLREGNFLGDRSPSSFHGKLINTKEGTLINGYFSKSLFTILFNLIFSIFILCFESIAIIVNLRMPTFESITFLFIPLLFAAVIILLTKHDIKVHKINEQKILDLIQIELNAKVDGNSN